MSSKTGLLQSHGLSGLFTNRLNKLQSSYEPSSKVSANALAVPSDLSDTTVFSSQTATGGLSSRTVTVTSQLERFSHRSYTL